MNIRLTIISLLVLGSLSTTVASKDFQIVPNLPIPQDGLSWCLGYLIKKDIINNLEPTAGFLVENPLPDIFRGISEKAGICLRTGKDCSYYDNALECITVCSVQENDIGRYNLLCPPEFLERIRGE